MAGYDLAVIGGGPGGYVAAIKASQLGLRVACIEGRGALGGTCLNVGCIPSKALLHASHLYAGLRSPSKYKKWGITGISDIGISIEDMQAKKEKQVGQLTGGIEYLLKKNKVEYIKGYASFIDPRTIEVIQGTKSIQIQADKTIIATGSEPVPLPFIDFNEDTVCSSTGALAFAKVPESLLIVGGGVIGLELGSVWANLGANVTVVEYMPRCSPFLDEDVSNVLVKSLREHEKINFLTQAKVADAAIFNAGNSQKVKLTLERAPDQPGMTGQKSTIDFTNELTADKLLVSVGRRPVTSALNLSNANLSTDKRGFIGINPNFETTTPGIFAIGDVTNRGPMLAHKAEEEGIAAVEYIVKGAGHINYNTIPGVIYTTPEVAWIGKSEGELKKEGVEVKVGKFSFAANSRAKAIDKCADNNHFVKIITNKKTDEILGAQIIHSQAGELIHEVALGLEYGASSEDLARTCHAHPTHSEAIKEACMACFDKPIHS